MYAGEKPWARRFGAWLMRDLIFLDALPARIERISGWWFVSADRDWLASNEGVIDMQPFFHIVNFPAVGQFGFRTEILLTALADGLVTSGTNGITWIRGDPETLQLPYATSLDPPNGGQGRLLAFKIEDEEVGGP